jgi:hypothetical protein
MSPVGDTNVLQPMQRIASSETRESQKRRGISRETMHNCAHTKRMKNIREQH